MIQLDATENEEVSDGVLVRLQSQQMLDQIHGDDPLQTSGTGPVDGDHDSSGSEGDLENVSRELRKRVPKKPGSLTPSSAPDVRRMAMVHQRDLDDMLDNKMDTVQNGNANQYIIMSQCNGLHESKICLRFV